MTKMTKMTKTHKTHTPYLWLSSLLLAAALLLTACDDGDSAGNTSDTSNADATGDSSGATDEVISIGDDLSGGEDATSGVDPVLAAAWPYNKGASDAAVTITEASGVFSAQIDAAAGGLSESSKRAFIYLDLDAGEKLAIDDFEAAANTAWDLAFKRSVIRSNGADSGPGNIQVGRMTDKAFELITEVPADLIFAEDVSFDVDNNLIVDPIGQPKTAFNFINPDTSSGSWYDYGANGVSAIPGHVYIIQDKRSGVAFKLELQSWTSGVYQVRWAKL
jgi:hypothetical protein